MNMPGNTITAVSVLVMIRRLWSRWRSRDQALEADEISGHLPTGTFCVCFTCHFRGETHEKPEISAYRMEGSARTSVTGTLLPANPGHRVGFLKHTPTGRQLPALLYLERSFPLSLPKDNRHRRRLLQGSRDVQGKEVRWLNVSLKGDRELHHLPL